MGFNSFESSRLPKIVAQLSNLGTCSCSTVRHQVVQTLLTFFHIESLIIPGMGLIGAIPSEVGSLTNLSKSSFARALGSYCKSHFIFNRVLFGRNLVSV